METYIAELWDWGFLDSCFGDTKIKVTDVDGLVERNGYFLLIETKQEGKDLPKGQSILFDHLIMNPHWAVMVVWGEPEEPVSIQFWGCEAFQADKAKMHELVERWFQYANAQTLDSHERKEARDD